MTNWNSYNSSKFQVEKFFRQHNLSQSQVDNLAKIIYVMSKYMLIDWELLNFYAGEKIGLSHIKRAIKLDIIVKLENSKSPIEEEKLKNHTHFYVLGFAGLNLLRATKRDHHCFDLLDSFESKEKVLMFNYNIANKGYKLLFSKYNDMKDYNFFHCQNKSEDTIFYFNDHITLNHVKAIMKKIYVATLGEDDFQSRHSLFNEFISKFSFKTLDILKTEYNKDQKNY